MENALFANIKQEEAVLFDMECIIYKIQFRRIDTNFQVCKYKAKGRDGG